MPQAYDSLTSQVVEVSDEDLRLNPGRLEPVQNQTTYMAGPDGKAYEVPASSAQGAVDAGWQFLTPQQAEHAKGVEFYRQKYDSDWEVGAGEAVNQFLFGVPDVMGGHDSTAKQEGKALAQEAHKTAQYVGGALGFAGNVVATGGIGKALQGGARGAQAVEAATAVERAVGAIGTEAGSKAAQLAIESQAPGLVARVGQVAARGAMEGAIYAAPQAVAHEAYGDSERAAETIMWGVGSGFALGGLLGLGAEGVNAARGALRGKAVAAGLIEESSGKATDLAREKLKEVTGPSLEEAVTSKAKATASLAEHSEALDKSIASKSTNWDKTVATKAKDLGVVPTDLAQEVTSKVLETRPGLLTGTTYAAERKELEAVTRKIADMGTEPIKFSDLQALKTSIAEAAGTSKVMRQVEQIVHDQQAAAMNKAYNTLGLTEKYAEFLSSKMQWQAADDFLRFGHQPPAWLKNAVGQGVNTITEGIAGTIGGGIGTLTGGFGGTYVGTKVAKPVVDAVLGHVLNEKGLQLAAGALRKIADNPGAIDWFGAALTKNAADQFRQKVMDLPLMLGTRVAVRADPVKAMLGERANGLSKDAQYKTLTRAIGDAKSNPELVDQKLQELASLMHFDPRLQQLAVMKHKVAIDYLHSTMPKDPHPPQPFEPVREYKASPAEKKAWTDRLEVAVNPWSVIDRVNNGTLSSAHVDALQALYPQLREQMVGAVMSAAVQGVTIPNGLKTGLSRLTGMQVSSVPTAAFQSVYQTPQPPKGGPGPQGGGRPHGGGGRPGPSLLTDTQRREFK